ncbi:uncharacterized protein TRIADDRAFT_24290, partial [Trichoplax adhaerens]
LFSIGAYEIFLNEEFDAKQYANIIIASQEINDSLQKLSAGINTLDRELHSQVVAHHDDLLSQATSIEALEGVLKMMQSRIESLQITVGRIQKKVVDPYKMISSRTAQLRNLQIACDILRCVIRVLYLSRRLDGQLQGGLKELTNAAQSLNELDYLYNSMDLTDIQMIEQDKQKIEKARQSIENEAMLVLTDGMKSQNQTKVATGLQVFHNLQKLQLILQKVIEKSCNNLESCVCETLDPNTHIQSRSTGPGRAVMPTPGNAAAWRVSLWQGMEKLMGNIYETCVQMSVLEKVLFKKKDPVTHLCFIEELLKDGHPTVMAAFWKKVIFILTHELSRATEDNTFLKQTFESEYPKLLRFYNDLWSRLKPYSVTIDQVTTVRLGSVDYDNSVFSESDCYPFSNTFSPELALRDSLSSFENAYLTRSLSRLFDPINTFFPDTAKEPPKREELTNIEKTVANELNAASVDTRLSLAIAKNVSKTIRLYCAKCERLIVTNSNAVQLTAAMTGAQTRNATVINSIYYLCTAVSKVLSFINLFVVVCATSALNMIKEAVEPLVKAMSKTIEAMILKIHQEDFASEKTENQIAKSECSSFIKDIQRFTDRIKGDYLARLDCIEIVDEMLNSLASRVLELFIRHISLVRPISDAGKLKIAADMAQMELAVGSICTKLSELGKSYKVLRCFRPLLFQTPEHILGSPALGENLPYFLVLNFLYSRAPPKLPSPYKASKWTEKEYSEWIDNHPDESERLGLIRYETLDNYIQSVRVSDNKVLPPIIVVMQKILLKASSHRRGRFTTGILASQMSLDR